MEASTVGAESHLQVNDAVRIPMDELEFKAVRAGGPGGQHVNTSSTKVEVWWDVGRSEALSDQQRTLLLDRLGSRLDSRHRLRLVSSTFRSQRRNRDEVLDRLRAVVAGALLEVRPRKPTRPPKGSREARLRDKKQRGELKRQRRKPPED
jgi:ribosome-associated protein